MEIFDKDKYAWNHRVGPAGNLGKIDPVLVAAYCNLLDVPWYASGGYPYSSGVYVYCEDSALWDRIITHSKVSYN